jgi:hypothetical protein
MRAGPPPAAIRAHIVRLLLSGIAEPSRWQFTSGTLQIIPRVRSYVPADVPIIERVRKGAGRLPVVVK